MQKVKFNFKMWNLKKSEALVYKWKMLYKVTWVILFCYICSSMQRSFWGGGQKAAGATC